MALAVTTTISLQKPLSRMSSGCCRGLHVIIGKPSDTGVPENSRAENRQRQEKLFQAGCEGTVGAGKEKPPKLSD
jgi:hypothetical protein